MKKFLVIASASLILVSCGGKKSGVGKDTKADYTVTVKDLDVDVLDSLADQKEEQIKKTYDDKIIEVKGVIKSYSKAEHAAAPNKFSFYLCTNGSDEDIDCLICYSDTEPKDMVGKTVTVKGKGSHAGVMSLVDCSIY